MSENNTDIALMADKSADLLSGAFISDHISCSAERELYVLESVDSTNDHLKKLALNGAASGTVVIADHQAKGKGRRGRTFISPSGCGIYLSYLFKPGDELERISDLTALAAVAVADAIINVCGSDVKVKWVNDLLVNGRKICGILTEAFSSGNSGRIDYCIIGAGINVNEDSIPSEIAGIATSLSIANNKVIYNRSLLAAEIIRSLDKMCSSLPGTEYYLNRYRELCITTGCNVTVFPQMTENGNGREGTAIEVNDDFSLKVRYTDGSTEDLRSGEVSVRGLYGYV